MMEAMLFALQARAKSAPWTEARKAFGTNLRAAPWPEVLIEICTTLLMKLVMHAKIYEFLSSAEHG